jgi:peptidyl-prolyl cis-trans isomerase SurA
VAFVDDDLITLYELNKKIQEVTGYSAAFLERSDKRKFDNMRRQVLNHMIDQKLAEKKVKELGINVSSQEVDAAIEHMKQINGMTQDDLMAKIKQMKFDYSEYREFIRSDLERMHLINLEVKSKIIIRDEDIKAYYEKNIEDYKVPGKVHLAGIFLVQKDPLDQTEREAIIAKANKISARLKNGEDFSRLAKEVSEGPGADEGGDLGHFEVEELASELAQAIESLAVGEFSEPLVGSGNVHIIKLIEKTEGRTKGLEEVRDAIRGILYKDEVNERYKSWIKELRARSYTKIML